MHVSVFDLFKIGIGPSSSHTVGPMWAALRFVQSLRDAGTLTHVEHVTTELYGSLALTGHGHATDQAILLGLSGFRPDTIDPETVTGTVAHIRQNAELCLGGTHRTPFIEAKQLLFHGDQTLPKHPNGIRFTACFHDGSKRQEIYYSVGGGFVVHDSEPMGNTATVSDVSLPYPFRNADELLQMGTASNQTIAEMIRANERLTRSDADIDAGLDRIWSVMDGCIERGCRVKGELPGGLRVRRRAARMRWELLGKRIEDDPLIRLDWVSLFALAVNEENAAGGRVVTAPTNGAAGVIPAVIAYYVRFVPKADPIGVRTFMLTAGAIGMLYKRNASFSAAEMGCQGEVGVACSMAAGGLAAVMGGNNAQIENAAEIGMEHNLGLTCDPIAGLVQVPCIERNTMGAIKAINAARLAVLHGDGEHRVSLDEVIETMRQTGVDMQTKYKETSLGGLAVNFVNC